MQWPDGSGASARGRASSVRALRAFFLLAAFAACGQTQGSSPVDAGAAADAGATPGCTPCVTDQDCSGATCTQLGSDSYCAPACANGDGCPADRACVTASSVTGDQVRVCVPRGDVCSAPPPTPDAGPPPSGACGSLAGPSVASSCTSCAPGKSGCQANGCFGGWWCNTATNRCQAPPASCATPGGPFDAGAPVTGTVGPNGGSLSRLLFAVVGDTRPASIDDTAGYPTAIIQKIYAGIQGMSPRPAFVVSTGDYVFASSFGTQAAPQLDLYLAARGQFSGPNFAAMGNHECTGATASNCGPGTATGITNNYSAFMSKMLGPINKTEPYYAITVEAIDHSWTAKFVFIAANAWTSAQQAWLGTTLAQSTTYTFIVRHESHDADTAPGVTASEQIMAQHPYTLAIVGHTHTYEHFSGREVIIGNGGAPISGGKNYGFGIFSQRPDGAIQVDMIDYSTGASDSRFEFAVKPNGTPAP